MTKLTDHIIPFASDAEAKAGTETNKAMSPASTRAAITDIVPAHYVYGIRYDTVNDIMVSGIAVGDLFIESDYTVFPIQEQMKRGLLNAGVFTLLDPNDSTKLFDGSAATLDGTAGQVMVRIPRFNALAYETGNYQYLLLSLSGPFVFQGQTSYVPPAFRDDDYRYIGAFQGVAATDALDADVISAVKDTSGYTTNPYPNPFGDRTRAQFRAQMQSGFFQYSWGLYEITYMLFITEYKTWNSQTALPGHTEASSYDYSYARPAGRTLSLGNSSGSILVDLTGDDSDLSGIVASDEYVANSFRGIENFYGNVWVFVDGINIDNTSGDCEVYVCHDPDNFADDTASNYIDTGHAPAFGSDDNYIKKFAWLGPDCVFYPETIGGGANDSEYITDYHYNNAGGWRVLRAGGILSTGALAGFGSGYPPETAGDSFAWSRLWGIKIWRYQQALAQNIICRIPTNQF